MRLIGRIILYLLATLGGIAALLVVAGIVFALRAGDDAEAPDKIVLTVDIGRGIVERAPDGLLSSVGSGKPLALRRVVEAIKTAETDPRVQGIVLDIGPKSLSIAHAHAIRRALKRFQTSGKFVLAFAESYGGLGNGTVLYYLASVADGVWMQPSGLLGLLGVAIEAPFVAGSLDKLDVKTQYEQRHEYKGAGEMFVRGDFSPEARESLQGLIDSWMGQMTDEIAAARKVSPDKLKVLFDNAPLLATVAKQEKLIDRLAYRDVFEDAVSQLTPNGSVSLQADRYLQFAPAPPSAGTRVALIHGTGTIVPGGGKSPLFGKSRQLAAGRVADAVVDAANDPSIKGIVLRIDSPGGSYEASDTVWRAVHVARENGKPVIASLGSTAASGGYFIAMAADRIVAEAGTVTGSIGVFTVKFATRAFWRKLGVEWDRVQSGPRAAMWSAIDGYPPGGADHMALILDTIYADFTGKVAKARGLDAAQLDRAARGRVWTGAAAKDAGLIDEIGGLATAYAAMAKQLDLPEGERLQIIELPRPSQFEAVLKTLRQQGLDVALPLAPLVEWLAASPALKIADELELLTPPVGVLQMPAWRLAR